MELDTATQMYRPSGDEHHGERLWLDVTHKRPRHFFPHAETHIFVVQKKYVFFLRKNKTFFQATLCVYQK